MIKLLVVADDFTGMLDTGVQFSKYSEKVIATTDYNIDFDSIPDDIEILIIDTETRHTSEKEAYNRLERLFNRAKLSDINYIYKKIDSVFRGNIGPELKAMADSLDTKNIPLVPSYPNNNRIIKDGKLYINKSFEDISCQSYDLDLKNKLIEEKIAFLTNSIDKELDKDFILMDAVDNEDLDKNLSYILSERLSRCVVGSAGFAESYAKLLFSKKVETKFELKSPLVVVCGSLNKVTKNQNMYTRIKGYPVITIDNDVIINKGSCGNEYKLLLDRIYTNIRSNKVVVIETSSVLIDKENDIYDDPRVLIGESLGEISKSLIDRSIDGTFLFTGGDTLFWCMEVLGVNSIRPIAEIEPGVVISKFNYMGKDINVITKSGGFGEDGLYLEILNKYMKGE